MTLLLNDNKVVVGHGIFTEEMSQYVVLTLKDDISFNPNNYTHIDIEDSALPAAPPFPRAYGALPRRIDEMWRKKRSAWHAYALP